MKRLVAGPWVGEFGWELMSWQGYLRARSTDLPVVVCGPAASKPLYADFCKEYIPFDLEGGVRDCWRRERCDFSRLKYQDQLLRTMSDVIDKPVCRIPLGDQKFIKFGCRDDALRYDVVCHARHPVGKCPQHSWPQAQWDTLCARLLNQGFKVAAIGTQAYLPAGAVDKRNESLDVVMNILRSSRLMCGPSSGPTLLANLCDCFHLTWTDRKIWSSVKATNRDRLERVWNPLMTFSRIVDDYSWSPTVEQLIPHFEEVLTLGY